MHIGIVGKGVVGTAIHDGFKQIGHQVTCYDIKDHTSSLNDLTACEIVYVCVPTPCRTDGSCDTSAVIATVEKLNALSYQGLVAIKSTVVPGTTQGLVEQYPNLRLCFVPEFLRAKSALSDFVDYHDILIVGTNSIQDYELVVDCHAHIPMRSIKISPGAAEMSKYFSNVFNALRIVFANGMYEICAKLNINYQEVLSAISHKSGIGRQYLRCDADYRGYSGECLPKDTMAFVKLLENLDLDHLTLFSAIINDNRYFTK